MLSKPISSSSIVAGIAGTFLVPAIVAIITLSAFGEISILSVLIAIALFTLVAAGLTLLFYRDVVHLTDHLYRVSSDLEAPGSPPPVRTEIARFIVAAVTRLRRSEQRRVRGLQRRLDATAAMVEHLNDPLLLIGPDRRVTRANAAAVSMFGAEVKERDLVEHLRHPGVIGAVDQVLSGGDPRMVEFARPVPIEQVFQAFVQPYSLYAETVSDQHTNGDEEKPVRSALVTLHDVTALRRSEQMRADFVANASHELRTPLSTLMGFIETLRGPARDDEAARERFLGIMEDQANRMSRLINDLLSLSRIELDEHTAPVDELDAEGILRGVIATLEMRAARRSMSFDIVIDPDLPPVAGDSDQLTQVFQNLIDNAINYAREGTAIRIEGERSRLAAGADGVGVQVSVIDVSEGIPRSHLARLTERFYRVDPARSRSLGGTGLGLAIVKHIVSRHRGRLQVESEMGRGSTFRVVLPSVRSNRGASGTDDAAAPTAISS